MPDKNTSRKSNTVPNPFWVVAFDIPVKLKFYRPKSDWICGRLIQLYQKIKSGGCPKS